MSNDSLSINHLETEALITVRPGTPSAELIADLDALGSRRPLNGSHGSWSIRNTRVNRHFLRVTIRHHYPTAPAIPDFLLG